ncbi:DUF1446 domain-containing protein [bacterium]|nr:DUF1446 domain-containing protein [bacterium]
MNKEVRILSLTGLLGYGYPAESLKEGMKKNPHFIGVDAGSSDPGPFYLGSGKSLTKKLQIKRDLQLAIEAAVTAKIPLIIGSAGTSGSKVHLNFTEKIIKEISEEESLSLKIALIPADINKKIVKQALKKNRVKPLGETVPDLTPKIVDESVRIVGQMGVAPFIDALKAKPDIILAGRACDTAIFASYPIMEGFDVGLSYHLAKILECGALASVPASASDCMFGIIGKDYFEVEPTNPLRKCTKISVAAHSLYEQLSPFGFYEPEGYVDLSGCKFVQKSNCCVRVTGSFFKPAQGNQTIKLEGVVKRGYHTIAVGGIRSQDVIKNIPNMEKDVSEKIKEMLPSDIIKEGYLLNFLFYGRDGVLGELEPEIDKTPYEVGIVIEGIAQTQDKADTVCALARSLILHYGFEGRKSTAGNVAFPFSPSDFSGGPVYEFSVYHLMEVKDAGYLFPVEFKEI